MPSIREMRYFEGMEIVEHESDDDTDEEDDVAYEENFQRYLQQVKANLIPRLSSEDDDSDDDLDEEFHHHEINEIEEVKEEKIKEEEFQQNYEIKSVIDILREQLAHNSVEIQNMKRDIEESIKQNKVKQYPCTECDTICVFPSDLQRHMRKHEENMEDNDEEDDAERCENTSASSDIKEVKEEEIQEPEFQQNYEIKGEVEKVEIGKFDKEVENGKESSKVCEENVEEIGIHISKLKISTRKKKRKKQKKVKWNEPRKWKSIKIINGKMNKIQEYLVIFSKIKKKKK